MVLQPHIAVEACGFVLLLIRMHSHKKDTAIWSRVFAQVALTALEPCESYATNLDDVP